ncbi:hypothetical protein BEWA_016970 [Theileria equi strain WA]|uniref:Uncharacterized protein n=1 Tax=Theileria equi strain WA TaxID=1537102 RepID=L1LA27_THEEQ|nr:hypothetical protein BEWA_016970 [Theileria equi strain WA]EKX72018.1 hypothetical protein BEWA_016970 [Theileria equi strain WA]|eukprot:XP_004831470.1 hypothetical protein BEWA_016970 [Theileria equi strain WA]
MQNCMRNKAHIINIMQIDNYYQCSSCNRPKIILHSTDENGYKKFTHAVSDSDCIGKLVAGSSTQEGIDSTKDVRAVTVFHYPPENPNPTLIYIPSGGKKWYQKKPNEKNKWEVVSEGTPEDDGRKDEILALLQKIRPNAVHNETTSHAHEEGPGNTGSETDTVKTQSSTPTTSISQNTSSSTVSIIVGAVLGVILAAIVIREGIMLRRNPEKSVTTRLMNRFHRLK